MSDFAADFAIRQLHAGFIDAVWRKDADAFAELFTTDGEWKIAGMHMRGREEIRGSFGKLLGVCDKVRIILGLPQLDITGETAVGRVHVTELAKMMDGASAITLGCYYDQMAVEDGRWLFKWRHWGMFYRGPFELSGHFVDSPDFGPFPGLPEAEAPTYVRPKA